MKISALVKISLSALAVTTSLSGEATEDNNRRDRNVPKQNYHTILQEIEDLTRRIHAEVDRVLAAYRRDTAEYHRRMGMTATVKPLQQQQREGEGHRQGKERQAANQPLRRDREGGLGYPYLSHHQDQEEGEEEDLRAYRAAYPRLNGRDPVKTMYAIRQPDAPERTGYNHLKWETKEATQPLHPNQGKVDEEALAVYRSVYPDLSRELAIEGLHAMQRQEAECLQEFEGKKKAQDEKRRRLANLPPQQDNKIDIPSPRTVLFKIIQKNHQEESLRHRQAKTRLHKIEEEKKVIEKDLNFIAPQRKEGGKLLKRTNEKKYKEIKEKDLKFCNQIAKIELEILKLNEVINSNNFQYYNSDESIRTVIEAALQQAPNLTEAAALFFARCVNCAKGNTIQQRIKYALQTFAIMKICNKEFSIQNLQINAANKACYDAAKRMLSFVHHYIEENFPGNDLDEKRLDNDNFSHALKSLKAALEMQDTDYFDEDSAITLEHGYKIIKLKKGLENDQRECSDSFQKKQDGLYREVNPETLNPYFITASLSFEEEGRVVENPITFNLQDEWDTVTDYIRDIERDESKGRILALKYDSLTYNDIYASFFDRKFNKTSHKDIQAIEDTIIRLVDKNPEMKDTAPCILIQPGNLRDTKKFVYFTENGFTYGIEANRIAESPRYFKYQTKTNLAKIGDPSRAKYHFKERIKLLFDLVPETRIPQEIVKLGKNSLEWRHALEEAQLEIATWLIPCLDDCDGGMSNKLTKLECRFKNVLGNMKQPTIPLIKEIAGIIREIKINRIYETGKHPQYDQNITKAYEEHQTAPDVLMQRLRGPLGLLGIYTPPIGTVHARPCYILNEPVQIIKNIFIPNQPARSYDIYEERIEYRHRNEPREITAIIAHHQTPVEGPALTVKSLIENLKTRYETDYLTFHEYIDDFIDGDLLLLKDRDIAMQGKLSVFFQEGGTPNDALYFYVLKRLGYVQFFPGQGMSAQDIETRLYTFNQQEDQPGTIRIDGEKKTLYGLIQEGR